MRKIQKEAKRKYGFPRGRAAAAATMDRLRKSKETGITTLSSKGNNRKGVNIFGEHNSGTKIQSGKKKGKKLSGLGRSTSGNHGDRVRWKETPLN